MHETYLATLLLDISGAGRLEARRGWAWSLPLGLAPGLARTGHAWGLAVPDAPGSRRLVFLALDDGRARALGTLDARLPLCRGPRRPGAAEVFFSDFGVCVPIDIRFEQDWFSEWGWTGLEATGGSFCIRRLEGSAGDGCLPRRCEANWPRHDGEDRSFVVDWSPTVSLVARRGGLEGVVDHGLCRQYVRAAPDAEVERWYHEEETP